MSDQSKKVNEAKRILEPLDGHSLVSMADDGTVVLDGDEFTIEQLEAIVYLMRHAPNAKG